MIHVTIRHLREDEFADAFAVLRQLRQQLSFELYLARLERQRQAGYELLGAFDPTLIGLLGMRPVETMARGRHLHVDDLVVSEAVRGKGIGRQLLAHAEQLAAERGLVAVFLDSRAEAMGFYDKLGYTPHTAVLVRKALPGQGAPRGT